MNQITLKKTPAKSYAVFSGSMLKVIAMISMFIDHAGIALLKPWHAAWIPWFTYSFLGKTYEYCLYQFSQDIGSLAFPIFGFLLVEGFLHTSNRVKYGRNLLIFAILSEIPFDLLLNNRMVSSNNQNIFFTLLIAYICICRLEYFLTKPVLQTVYLAGSILLADTFHLDHGGIGVIFILILYFFRYAKLPQTIVGCLSLYSEWTGCFAFIPIRLYNGARGFIQGKWMKYLFYAFYPIHILLLVLLRFVIYGSIS